jgi:hypothetical protein
MITPDIVIVPQASRLPPVATTGFGGRRENQGYIIGWTAQAQQRWRLTAPMPGGPFPMDGHTGRNTANCSSTVRLRYLR